MTTTRRTQLVQEISENVNMNQYILVEHQNNLNEQIQKPIQQSQRIKFTCFDVSLNHIAFGASSGGIYIYKRRPSVFLKILPTKEGAIDHLSISHDEYFVAVSNQKGLIIVIENCFFGSDLKFQIYNHHDNNKVTVLKWHLCELYSGDINGKVCVTALKNVLSKSIFQIPFSTLMHLDSSIVQIDCYLQYLLISTRTKTLFCDTAHEQYKQIGKKLRDGPHGACFHNIPEKVPNVQFNIRQEPHSSEAGSSKYVTIFCSRPGLRLWQVDLNTSVLCTHQLKNAKPQLNKVYKITDDKTCRPKKETINRNTDNDSATNFYRMHLLRYNLMLTFNDSFVYILRVTESKVTLLYKLQFPACIQDIRIAEDNFYVLLETCVLSCYSIFNLENFILYALNLKQYLLCADICLDFKEIIYDIYEQSENLHELSTLKLNLEDIQELSLLNELNDLFEFIKSKHTLTVNRNSTAENSGTNHTSECENIHLPPDNETIEVNKFDDSDFCIAVIIKQFKLNVQYHVDYPDYMKLLEYKSMFDIMNLFENIRTSECDVIEKDLIVWCSKQFLNLVSNNITTIVIDKILKDYIIKCFKNLNNDTDKHCKKCKYPLPTAKDTIPDCYHLICDIFKEDSVVLLDIATEIPYVWKYLLECDVNLKPINKWLPVIIQLSDIAVLEQYADKLNYDLWDEAVNLMIKIKSKRCLYCDNEVDIDVASTISWQSFANVAIRAMGPTNVLKLFKTYAASINNTDLGPEFYQNFIFIAAMDNAGQNRGTSTHIFQSAMNQESQKIEMECSLAKYLNNAFLQRNNHSHLDISPISSLKNILSNKL